MRGKLDRRAARRPAPAPALSLLLVLGCGLVALSLVAVYVRATVLDTDRYVETMAPIAESPAVQQAVADKLDTAITQPGRLRLAAARGAARPGRPARPGAGGRPPAGDPLAARRVRGVRQLRDAVGGGQPARALARRGAAHHRRVEPAAARGRHRLPRPRRGRSTASAQALQERGLDRLAAAIPPSVDGRVTLLQSEGFVKAREAVDLLESLTIVLPILALLCLAGHVALSRPRRRGLLRVGLGLIVTALLLLAAVGIGRSAYLTRSTRTCSRATRRPTSSTR